MLLQSSQSQPNPEQTNTTNEGESPVKLRGRGGHLPCEDHDKIHHVPAVAQVRAFVKNKAQSDDFDTSFKTKYSNKVRLSVVLEKKGNERSQGVIHVPAVISSPLNSYRQQLHTFSSL